MEIQNPIACETQSTSLASEYRIEIDVTPQENAPTWAELRAGITEFSHSTNDVLDQPNYMDGAGWGSTEVTGGQYTVTVSGDRISGDAAQDFVFSKALKFGCERKTNCRITDPVGSVIESVCTLANMGLPSGSAGGKASFSFDLHFNGEPVYTPAVSG